MPRGKRKRAIVESDSESKDSVLVTRRSSLRVNLSFTSRLSDSDDGSSRKGSGESDEILKEQDEDLSRTVRKRKHNTKSIASDDTATPASLANATVINAADSKVPSKKPSKSPKNSILSIDEKDQQLDKSCTELRNAIISKTQVLLDNELRDKTSKVLTGCFINIKRVDNENSGNTTPRVRINIGKNEQILMAGCGEKLHPVQINSMSKSTGSKEHDHISSSQDSNHSDCSQSIASTPKKSNIETCVDKSTGKTSKQIINIPVARLFADNDPNISMSGSSPVLATEVLKSPVSKGNNSNIPRICNELNSTTSPILSQGMRKNRICRLSLKRKSTTNKARNSRVSTNVTNESFVNRPPLTCSSFIEGLEKTCNKSQIDQHTKTIIVEDKSESSANQKTINLDDNENDTNTINIDHSSNKSSMEITTISARTPIVRKPFQQVIQESFRFDTADIPGTQKSSIPNRPSINADENLSEKVCKSNSDDCSDNTVKTSSNVNTSLDDVSLAERVTHKENRRPSPAKQLVAQTSKNNTDRESQTITTMRSSLRVNTSLDSVRKSSDSSKTDSEPEKRKSAQLQPSSSNSNNQEKHDSTETRPHRPSNGTVRSSMQVNTSLDSVQKSPNEQEPLNYQKILSMVQEASTDDSQTLNLQCRSSDNDSEKESIALAERIQDISASKNKQTSNDCSEDRRLKVGRGKSNLKRKSNEPEPSCPSAEKSKVSDKSKSKSLQKSDSKNSESTLVESDKSSSKRRKSARKSNDNSTNESSVVEATPFPASRSLLFKTIIKNNIAMNTLNPRKLVDGSDDEENDANSSRNKQNSLLPRQDAVGENSSDTFIVDTSDESANESNKKKEKVVIDESMNDTGNQSKTKIKRRRKLRKKRESKSSDSSDEEEAKKKMMNKRKLYPLRENSQISFSPAEMTQPQPETAPKDVKRKKKRKMIQKKQEDVKVASPEPDEESDHAENEIYIPKPEKKKKKPRKIKSKKIVVKKVTNLTLLTNIMENNDDDEPPTASTSRRSSLRDFDLRRVGNDASHEIKSHKIVIVVTGHDKDDRDLVKNVIKGLGSAILQANVTPRTTHVISSGVRTINLLKGIIRGCWLLTLEWALKSLESGKWLDPSPYEMSHFAKAVQINRRDRRIFGKAYVPELFITCGPVYIENGTTPPASALKELVKTAGGRITEDVNTARVVVGSEGLKENWILDSITTGEIQPFEQYKRN